MGRSSSRSRSSCTREQRPDHVARAAGYVRSFVRAASILFLSFGPFDRAGQQLAKFHLMGVKQLLLNELGRL